MMIYIQPLLKAAASFPLHAYVPMRNNTNDYADSILRPDLIIVHPSMLKVENLYHPDSHHPETNHNHLLPPNLPNEYTTQNYGSTILKCVK
jgi:hypothetical protein